MRDEPKDAVKGPETEAHWTNQKGVGFLRQQDGGHGSRNPLRSV
jgi:hypothetical protein